MGDHRGDFENYYVRRTRQKLNEALFFLQEVREHYGDVLDPEADGPHLIYYVSAFVSAARSVTWVMKSEFCSQPGWEEWYESKEAAVEDRTLLQRFTNIRNRSQKRGPLQVDIRLYASVSDEHGPGNERHPVSNDSKLRQYRVMITQVNPPTGVPRSCEAVLDALECGLPELGEDDLLHSCNRYVDMLTRLVDECEARFPQSPI